MKQAIIAFIFLAFNFGAPAFADDSMPLFYTREVITIQRKADPMPWQEGQPPQQISGVTFDVEVRDAKSYYNQKDWFNLSGPTDDSGVLLVFAKAVQSPIIASKQYAPLDILFVDAQGKITQVVPNILLSNLSQQILPQNPVLAFLFLKGQTCERLGIKPGDVVDYKIFNKQPIVLGDPVSIIDTPAQPEPEAMPKQPTPSLMLPPRQSAPTDTSHLVPQLPSLPPVPEIVRATQEKPQIVEKPLAKPTAKPLPKDIKFRSGE